MIELPTIRKATHLSQEEFATCLRVPVSTYSKWEQGVSKPGESQNYLMSYYAYHEGLIKTYLNDPKLKLTEMGLIMKWVRNASQQKYSMNNKQSICRWFEDYIKDGREDGFIETTYQRLYKHYIVPWSMPKVAPESEADLTDFEKKELRDRAIDRGVVVLPYDGSAFRSTDFDPDTFFFFTRLSTLLGMDEMSVSKLLVNDCHDSFFWDDEISLQAKALLNCLYYRYSLNFPLAFDVATLRVRLGEAFDHLLYELIRHNYADYSTTGYISFRTDLERKDATSCFYIGMDEVLRLATDKKADWNEFRDRLVFLLEGN